MQAKQSQILLTIVIVALLATTVVLVLHQRSGSSLLASRESGSDLVAGPRRGGNSLALPFANGSEADRPSTNAAFESAHLTYPEKLGLLLEQARSGDSSALVDADALTGLCSTFMDASSEDDTWSPSSTQQRAAQLRVAEFCGLISQADAREIVSVERELLLEGEPWAMARHFRTPASISEDFGVDSDAIAEWAWEESLVSREPETTRALLDMLFNRWDSPAAKIPETRAILEDFNSHPAFANSGPSRQQTVRALALDVLACRQGARCPAYGPMQESYCIYRGLCASHLRTDQFVLQELLNSHERQAAEQFIRALQDTRGD